VTIFAKGIPAENVSVEFGEQIVRLKKFDAFCLCSSFSLFLQLSRF
jgi:hypothetical protein